MVTSSCSLRLFSSATSCSAVSVSTAPVAAQAPATTPTVPVSPDEVVRGDPMSPRIALVINAGAGYTPSGQGPSAQSPHRVLDLQA